MDVLDLRSSLAAILAQCQKYISTLDLCQACIKSLNNLAEQLDATEHMLSSHPILRQQPNVAEKLTRCIHSSITDQVADLQTSM